MKEILSDFRSVIILLTVLLIIVAILGGIPTGSAPGSFIALNTWQRILIAALSIAVVVAAVLISRYSQPKDEQKAPPNEEYSKQFRKAQAKIKEMTPENSIMGEADYGDTRVLILNDNITNARTDILVSSDDNYFQAKGGVAKAILEEAGPDVRSELERYRKHKWRQGDIVITTGGLWGIRAIFHPAVIDLDEHRYPDQDLIRKIVRRCLYCGQVLGARSIAFPVIGGGTASKHLTPWDSIQAIISETLNYLRQKEDRVEPFSSVVLYVYDKRDITGDLEQLLSPESKNERAANEFTA